MAQKYHLFLGIALIVCGGFFLYDRLIRWIWHVQIVPSWLLGFVDDLPSMLVSFGIIALGVWLVRGKRMPADEVEDFPQYRKESEGEKEEHGHGKRTA